MSESAAKQMRSPAIDLEEFERRLRAPEPVRRNDDPLAELARLVGSNDPFRGITPPQAAVPALPQADSYALPDPQQQVVLTADTAPQVLRSVAEQMRNPPSDQIAYADHQAAQAYESPQAYEPAYAQPAVQWEAPTATAAPAQPQWAEPEQPAYTAPRDFAPPPPPDMSAMEPPARRGMSRKGMLYMGSAVAVLVVGLGATFATGGRIGGSVPTISASREPVKVKPEGEEEATAPRQVRTISILDKAAGSKPVPAKAVSREEQPVDLSQVQAQPRGQRVPESDLNQMVNLTSADAGKPVATVPARAGAPQHAGYFPEPRKVKTVAIRPDGSVVVEPPAAAPVARPPTSAVAPAQPVARPAPAAPQQARAAAPAPEKATARAARAPAEEADAAPVASTRAPARATQERAAAPAPQRVAAVAPATTPAAAAASTGAGGFAVQLAAPPSEAEAKATVLRLRQKFGAELGSRSPSVRPATIGDKTVYRVRIGGLSREDATALCQKLQGKGGACFVAKN